MNIAKQTTDGITVSVICKYQEEFAKDSNMPFNFSYTVEILNDAEITIQLLAREWRIFDTFGSIRYVKGEGVIGEQPILAPGQLYKYTSWSGLQAPIGNMSGHYEMVNVNLPEQIFFVKIPKFVLCADYLSN